MKLLLVFILSVFFISVSYAQQLPIAATEKSENYTEAVTENLNGMSNKEIDVQKKETYKGIFFTNGLSWSQLIALATKENKYIFIDAFATWCAPCKFMEKEIYSHSEIGDFFNKNFISVKVQMDSTKFDNEDVKKWYPTARNFMKKYSVSGFPTYLFFSSDGKLVHREQGAKKMAAFKKIGADALDKQKQIYTQLANYRSGKIMYTVLPTVFVYAKRTNNRLLADSIADDYKRYLDRLPENLLLEKNNLEFLGANAKRLTSNDLVFKIALRDPKRIDMLVEGLSDVFVKSVITREEVDNKLWNGKAPRILMPDWEELIQNINKKYPEIIERMSIVNDDKKLSFYNKSGNWKEFAKLKSKMIAETPLAISVKTKDYAFYKLNVPAWSVFLACTDTSVLEEALHWVDLAIQLEPNKALQALDTRSNLLYKIGRINEAIEQEEKALEMSINIGKKNGRDKGPLDDAYKKTLEKMKSGIPTWNIADSSQAE